MGKQYSPLDMSGLEIRNYVVQNLGSAPSGAKAGQKYYSTSVNGEFTFNGTAWRPTDAALLTDGSIQNSALQTNPLLRANHTGTQTSSTISDLGPTVKAFTLDTFAAPVASVSFGGQRITNLANGTGAQDAVTLSQVNSIIAAAIAGQTSIKVPVKVYADANITLSGTQTIQGVQLAVGDRVLAGAQGTSSQIGIYNVASGAWSLASDANSAGQIIEGTEVLVAEGSYAGAIFRQTTTGTITPGTTTQAWVQTAKINNYSADGTTLVLNGMQFSVNYGLGLTVSNGKLAVDTSVVARKYAAPITHDGSTTTFNITHSLGTVDVEVQIRDSNGNKIDVDNQATSTTVVQVQYGAVPANGTVHRVIVVG